MMRRRTLLTASGVLASGLARAQPASVDVLLALGIDVSRSVTDDEARLQRDGYRGAMTDPAVLAAIQNGPTGAIAVAYFEWARFEFQDLIVPWTRIASAADAQAWSARLAAAPYQSVTWTSISGALRYAGTLLAAAPFQADRRVVDISGDGANNHGPPAEPERDSLVANGITINGLPIINRNPRFGRYELDVDKYYAASVIGGPGAFLIVAEDFSAFSEAIKRKLLQEIS